MNDKVKPGHNYSEEKGNVYGALKLFSLVGFIPLIVTLILTRDQHLMLVLASFIYSIIITLGCMKIHLLVRRI
jgi:hypothetical protein